MSSGISLDRGNFSLASAACTLSGRLRGWASLPCPDQRRETRRGGLATSERAASITSTSPSPGNRYPLDTFSATAALTSVTYRLWLRYIDLSCACSSGWRLPNRKQNVCPALSPVLTSV